MVLPESSAVLRRLLAALVSISLADPARCVCRYLVGVSLLFSSTSRVCFSMSFLAFQPHLLPFRQHTEFPRLFIILQPLPSLIRQRSFACPRELLSDGLVSTLESTDVLGTNHWERKVQLSILPCLFE